MFIVNITDFYKSIGENAPINIDKTNTTPRKQSKQAKDSLALSHEGESCLLENSKVKYKQCDKKECFIAFFFFF